MAILICMYVRYNCREVWQKICSNALNAENKTHSKRFQQSYPQLWLIIN